MEVQLLTASVCSVYEKGGRGGGGSQFSHRVCNCAWSGVCESREGGGVGKRGKEKRPSACFIRVPGEKDYGAGMWCKAQSFWVWSHHCQQHWEAEKQCGSEPPLTAPLALRSLSLSSFLILFSFFSSHSLFISITLIQTLFFFSPFSFLTPPSPLFPHTSIFVRTLNEIMH